MGQTKFNVNANWYDFNATREVIFKIMQEKGSFLIHFTSLFRGGESRIILNGPKRHHVTDDFKPI